MSSSPVRRLSAVLLAAWALATVGCSLLSTETARNGWAEEWGPMVPHDTFPGECSLCHYPDAWDDIKESFDFDHEAETGVALNGAHADATCLRCHNDRGPVEAYAVRGCGGCHTDPHQAALGLDCTRCHTEVSWTPEAIVAEHAGTRFPLVGAHAFTNCESCHLRAPSAQYRGAPVECHLCHQREAAGASPNHVVNGWIRNCEDCHFPTDWRAVNFDHSVFALVGGHAIQDCNACHVGGRVAGTPNDCFSCHRRNYLAAPNHVAENRSTMCAQCHSVFDWTPIAGVGLGGRR